MSDFITPRTDLTNLCRAVLQYIASHPLVINPVVKHPITGKRIYIERYRNYDGLAEQSGLTCSVFANSTDSLIPPPQTLSASAVYEPVHLGSQGADLGRFHIVVKYSFNEVTLGNIEEFEVPASAIFNIGQKLLTSNIQRSVKFEVNPGMEIIQGYLSLTKVILDDFVHRHKCPLPIKSLQVLYENVKSKRWEEKDNIYFQEGVTMLVFDAYVYKGWNDQLIPLHQQLSSTNLDLN